MCSNFSSQNATQMMQSTLHSLNTSFTLLIEMVDRLNTQISDKEQTINDLTDELVALKERLGRHYTNNVSNN